MRSSTRKAASIKTKLLSTAFLLLSTTGALAQQDAPVRRDSSAFGTGLMGGAVVQYDNETGTLMIITDEATNLQLDKIIKNLDQPVPQVLIKVLFLEVTHSKGLDFGAEAFFTSQEDTDLLGNAVSSETSGTGFGVAAQVGQAGGAFYSLLQDDLALTVRALADAGSLEVLSRPSILARNNEEAAITVGNEVPFIRSSQITNTGLTINTVEYEDIGIILQVTPRITPNGLVEMLVNSEISTLTGETIAISEVVQAPVFAKRSAETRVIVPDGQTVVIGGLMEDNVTETVRKVPILGDIPLLGMAFRRKIISKVKTELLIFLTPHVARGPEELRSLSEAEAHKAELIQEVFTEKQLGKYLDTLDVRIPAETVRILRERPPVKGFKSQTGGPRETAKPAPGVSVKGIVYNTSGMTNNQ